MTVALSFPRNRSKSSAESNLWLCLYPDCFMLGCSEGADHSSRHYDNYPEHFVQLNVDTRRIWCYRLVLWCVIIQHYSALIAACSKSDATMR